MRRGDGFEMWVFRSIVGSYRRAGASGFAPRIPGVGGHRLKTGATCALGFVLFVLPAAGAERVGEFSFLQISDIHINPHPVNGRAPGPDDRSVEAVAWVCEEATKPQALTPFGMEAPPPRFVIATGDLTEYGVIHETWADFEGLFAPLKIPLYVSVGNHDDTWTAMRHIMRKRHGGDHYSFEEGGCHFACINSASPQEPVPSFEQRTLTWLRKNLARVPAGRPVFVFCHHPLSSTEFAKPHEQLRLLEVLRGHNVAAVLMGHGHSPRSERWGTLDSVMGGSTFGPNTGYSIIDVREGTLRVVYRFKDARTPMKVLLEKPIAGRETATVEIVEPGAESRRGVEDAAVAMEEALAVVASVRGGKASGVTATLDDEKAFTTTLTPGDAGSAEQLRGAIPLAGCVPGMHYLRVTANVDGVELDRVREVLVAPRGSAVRGTRVVLDAGIKAGPVAVEGGVIVATTAGQIARVTFDDDGARVRPIYDAGVEILHSPAVVDGVLYVSAAEKGVIAVGLDRKLQWACDVGAVVYGTPAVTEDRVYVGDLEGMVHAIDRRSGKITWSKRHAVYSIEQPITYHEGVLYFGDWEGFVNAVNARTGGPRWRQRGPAGQSGDAKLQSRYYAPGDCSPVIAGGRLFVSDRAYRCGYYTLGGEYLGELQSEAAAVSASADGGRVYVRGQNAGLTCYNAEGKRVWRSEAALGRFPVPPTEAGGRAYVCSNRGLLTALDAATGEMLWKYQAVADLHVMSAVAADERGNVYVGGMDGSVTRVNEQR